MKRRSVLSILPNPIMNKNYKIQNMIKNSRFCRIKHVRPVLLYVVLSTVVLAIGWSVWGLCMPRVGDDLIYTRRFYDDFYTPLRIYNFANGIWHLTNSRFADMLLGFWLGELSRPLLALCLGAGVVFAIWSILRIARISTSSPIVMGVISLLIFAILPWWNMDRFVCHINYVFGIALCFPCLIEVLYGGLKNKKWKWLAPFVFIFTGFHEALGFPIGCGLFMYLIINKKTLKFDIIQKWWLVAMFLGALFCISSPACYERFASKSAGDGKSYDLIYIFAYIIPMVTVLLIRVIVLLFRRNHFLKLIRTPWILFVTAAFCSSVFTIVGGVAGRGGWYAQVFAIVAIAIDLLHLKDGFKIERKYKFIAVNTLGILCVLAACLNIIPIEKSCRQTRSLVTDYMNHPERREEIAGTKDWVRTSLSLCVDSMMRCQLSDSYTYKYKPLPVPNTRPNPVLPYIDLPIDKGCKH